MMRFCQTSLVTLFLAVIFIPAAGWLAGWQFNAGIEEKRTPTPWPTLAELKKDAAGAAKQFENAFSDRFAFRNALIKTDAWLNWKVFGISTTDSVIVGRDGWLFFTGDRSVPLFQGIDRFTDADSAYVADALEMRHRWLRNQGIASAHVIAPAKESVYPEFMPTGIPRVKQPSTMEDFLRFGEGRDGQPVDLLTPLTTARKLREPLYLRGDSHWNDAGALVAYREILKRLSLETHGLSGATLQSRVDPETHPYHDLATMLGITETYRRDWPNDSPVIAPPNGWTFQTTADPVQRMRRTANSAPLIEQRVLVFGDSFSEALLPFLAQTFSSVDLFQGRYFSPAKVLELKPQVVLLESAERLFFHNRPCTGEEARVIQSPAWKERVANAGGRAQVQFDSTRGWSGVTTRPRQPVNERGPLRLRATQDRVALFVPLALHEADAHAAPVVQARITMPCTGVLKWQLEQRNGDATAPSWPLHLNLDGGPNEISFGLPARGADAPDRLSISIQTDNKRGEITFDSLRVLILPPMPDLGREGR
ncbi:MAG: hypothetical protein K1X78_20750 [Verrucomicrobiaceae bacterium]|nr:hypothetical protein [Verrucomicrobiaceae bacterium]